MCETSKTPAEVRTATCSWRIPSYWTGISQPANGTSRAPARSWRSNSGVRRSVSVGGKPPGRLPPGTQATAWSSETRSSRNVSSVSSGRRRVPGPAKLTSRTVPDGSTMKVAGSAEPSSGLSTP